MKSFRVTINGNAYDVDIDELAPGTLANSGGAQYAPNTVVATAASAPTAPLAVAAASAAAPTVQPATVDDSAPANATKVTAPMPGAILDVKVSKGDKVTKNQVVMVLEAMKMENEIVSPIAGTVTSVNVAKGKVVNSGELLITIS